MVSMRVIRIVSLARPYGRLGGHGPRQPSPGKEDRMTHYHSRRAFLGGSFAALGASMLAACGAPPPPTAAPTKPAAPAATTGPAAAAAPAATTAPAAATTAPAA